MGKTFSLAEAFVAIFALAVFLFVATVALYSLLILLDSRVWAPRRRRKRGY